MPMKPRVPAVLAVALLVPAVLATRSIHDEPLVQLREVEAPALVGAGQQNLAVGPDGRVYFSWIDRLPDSSTALRFGVLGGSGWSAPRTVAQGRDWFINWADFPSLLVLGENRLAAHWLQKSSLGRYSYDVRLSRSSDGGLTWTTPVVPHRDATPTEHGFAALWPGPDGEVGAAWIDGRKHVLPDTSRREMTLRAATFGARGELGPEVELDERICDCCQTAVAVTAEGPVIVYRDRTAGEVRDIAIVRQVGGAWTAPRVVAADGWEINACPVNGPMVAADARRVVVAWYTGARDTRRVLVAFSDDAGATFAAPVQVDDGHPVGRVAVVLVPGGDALVSWLEDTPAGAEVRVRRVGAGGERGEAQAVARTVAGRPSGFPRMVRSGDRVVFAWREPESAAGARVRTATARLREER